MQRHNPGFCETENEQEQQHRHQLRAGHAGQDAAAAKIESSGHRIGHQHGRQGQTDGGAQNVGQIFAPGSPRLQILFMGDQRIGGKGENLVEQVERQEIAGEGHADGCTDGDGETGEIAGLIMLLETAHVPDGINRGQNPQKRGDQGEGHPHGVDPQFNGDAGENFCDRKGVGHPIEHCRNHRGNQQKLGQRNEQSPGLAHIGSTPRKVDGDRTEQ